jgi:hypothetical protein
MKKVIFRLFAMLFVLTMAIPGFAGSPVICGCYKKQIGQLRIVDDTSECRPSEQPICWNTGTSLDFTAITLYVSASRGIDAEGRGLSQDQPWKTIQFALNRVTPLRITPEINVTIIVEPGTYEELVSVNKDRIWLQGSGNGNTFLRNSGGSDVLTIDGARGFILSGFTVEGGIRSIYAKGSASIELRDINVRAGNRGIQVEENSSARIVNCVIEGCLGEGIIASLGSTITLQGTVTSSLNFRGMLASGSSSVFMDQQSTLYVQNNKETGLMLRSNSHADILGTFNAIDNAMPGVFCLESSAVKLDGATLIQGNGYAASSEYAALQVTRGSNARIMNTARIVDNFIAGIASYKGSSIEFQPGSENRIIIQGNRLDGIRVIFNSQLSSQVPSLPPATILVVDNGGRGLYVDQNSATNIQGGALISGHSSSTGVGVGRNSVLYIAKSEISGNDVGIGVDGSTAEVQNCTITGNTSRDLGARFGSQVSLYGNTIGTIGCDGTVISRGSNLCPAQNP